MKEAAAVIFELFASPLLARLQGTLVRGRLPLVARLGCDRASPPDVKDRVPVSLTATLGRLPAALPVEGHRAGSISRLGRADAWRRIPVGQGHFAEPNQIEVLPVTPGLARHPRGRVW